MDLPPKRWSVFFYLYHTWTCTCSRSQYSKQFNQFSVKTRNPRRKRKPYKIYAKRGQGKNLRVARRLTNTTFPNLTYLHTYIQTAIHTEREGERERPSASESWEFPSCMTNNGDECVSFNVCEQHHARKSCEIYRRDRFVSWAQNYVCECVCVHSKHFTVPPPLDALRFAMGAHYENVPALYWFDGFWLVGKKRQGTARARL